MQTENYYDIPALSASGINRFYKTPLHFWKESPFNPQRKERKATPAMVFGRLCHTLILEPENFDNEFFVGRKTEGDLRTSIKQEIYDKAIELANAVKANKTASELLDNGKPEYPIYWEREGVRCKAKLDYYKEGLVIDYKTSVSASPDDFCGALVNYGYHRQASWYLDAVYHEFGEYPEGFVFIVQEKEMPDAIAIYNVSNEAIEIGEYENQIAFDSIKERLKTGNWDAFSPEATNISLPYWYKTKPIGEVA